MILPNLLRVALLLCLPTLVGCRSMYYSAMESFGREKRDILISRVEKGRNAQVDAKEQFKTTLEAFNDLTGSGEGGESWSPSTRS